MRARDGRRRLAFFIGPRPHNACEAKDPPVCPYGMLVLGRRALIRWSLSEAVAAMGSAPSASRPRLRLQEPIASLEPFERLWRRVLQDVAQPESFGIRIQVMLPLQVGHAMSAQVVLEQGEGRDKRYDA